MLFSLNKKYAIVERIIAIAILVLVAAAIFFAFLSAKKTTRDKQRVVDVNQMKAALDLYYKENGYYPYGQGINIPSGMADYISFWPTAPKPADGNCTNTQNNYFYSQSSDGSDFSLTFCLGPSANGYSAGYHTLTSKGIRS
jgi:type II secretory pathway pseudopilin PulG